MNMTLKVNYIKAINFFFNFNLAIFRIMFTIINIFNSAKIIKIDN